MGNGRLIIAGILEILSLMNIRNVPTELMFQGNNRNHCNIHRSTTVCHWHKLIVTNETADKASKRHSSSVLTWSLQVGLVKGSSMIAVKLVLETLCKGFYEQNLVVLELLHETQLENFTRVLMS